MWKLTALLGTISTITYVSAQTFQRLGACPTLGCVFPPDQTDFLPGQLFDIRLEVHAPVNGSEAYNGGVPDEKFAFCVQRDGTGSCVNAAQFFKVSEPKLEKWSFSYYEDLFAWDKKNPSVVNVAAKAYRALSLTQPGSYTAILTYYGQKRTVARWLVREPAPKAKAKNVILFIGDGMTQSAITAARLIGHKSINGKYQSLLQMDKMDNLGHQMTHSLDSFITDSANSASALLTGKKSTVDTLNIWKDSSADAFDDPKIETIAELFRRTKKGLVGIVTTAFVADATPAAMCTHTQTRLEYKSIVYEYLYGTAGITPSLHWPTGCDGPDVLFGGGAERFIPGPDSPHGLDFYKAFKDRGYKLVQTKEQLLKAGNDAKTLGIFTKSNLAKWLDRNVYPENLKNQHNSPTGDGSDALDQPGLKEMTLKAIDILQNRSKSDDKGWFLLSEAASIDKMMHFLDYDRALGDLLELDDTVRATIEHLKRSGQYENTLIVVTADHGHGFDVFGGADTEYIAAQSDDRKKRYGVGVYDNSGLSGYQVAAGSLPTNNTIVIGPQGPGFPVQWQPRYALAAGTVASTDRREGYKVNTKGPRVPVVASSNKGEYVRNPDDQPTEGTIPVNQLAATHSLQDVSVFANGPGADAFRGVYSNIDIFYKMADALGLGSEHALDIERSPSADSSAQITFQA
ncbi:hypothetical protein AMATHDRAFT_138775 [Amanita thiersii Skay4041]|uniref:alkaline phosphatase n=1 Tax=Amanita thiersii Skay4041 TaxID=703135 RepID=A0A2A9NYG5_9AGAR|nr:hypothetical protein AMATHDRAFT_138775 [Amanita thiersii Skay4041]